MIIVVMMKINSFYESLIFNNFSEKYMTCISANESKCAANYLNYKQSVACLLLVARSNNSQESVDVCVVIMNAMELIGLRVEFRQSVSWTMDYVKKLRQA